MRLGLVTLLIVAVIAVVAVIFAVVFFTAQPTVAPTTNTITARPLIVDHFACSDYCPGPREQYMVKIYDGVTDEATCLKLGGEPRTYIGWGEHHICVVK